MSKFENVSVVKKANVYFNGAVSSRTLEFSNAEIKTLGVMQVGEYRFNTGKKELMEILSGECSVLCEGETKWKSVKAGEHFYVKANSFFDIKVLAFCDYCCSFIAD